jgi:hypothetical protein
MPMLPDLSERDSMLTAPTRVLEAPPFYEFTDQGHWYFDAIIMPTVPELRFPVD